MIEAVEKFKSDFCSKVSELIVGDPLKLDTEFGAISSEKHFHKIKNYDPNTNCNRKYNFTFFFKYILLIFI